MKLYLLCLVFLLIACNSETKPSKTEDSTTNNRSEVVLDQAFEAGKALFANHCSTCHHRNVVDDMVGPALYGVEGRWENKEDLVRFIQDPQALINDNHPRAKEVSDLWPSEMTANPSLTTKQVESILYYIEKKGAGK